MKKKSLPYEGVRVIEFSHMVMGPSCGMVLADLGAEVIKVEPIEGDRTRDLLGSGAGFFSMFNRNKKSIAVNLKSDEGRTFVEKLVAGADIVSENFRSGVMAQYGFDYATLSKKYPKIIYVSHKGFLPGPYDHRTALDEVVQMMGGLAYMTGPEGQPLRAGSSVNDIMGGIFGAIGVMAALRTREHTGIGQEVQSALFENNVLLVGQHMMQYASTGVPASPMPSRVSAWGIYDVFKVKDEEQIFLAVVSDGQWETFCDAFKLEQLKLDERLKTNNLRVENRTLLLPILREMFLTMDIKHVAEIFEKNGLPYAPITKPQELFNDPHLAATNGLGELVMSSGPRAGKKTKTPLLPITIGGNRLPIRLSPPQLGEHTQQLMQELGYSEEAFQDFIDKKIIK
ncbi:CoA transferase [Polynucleobacter sp. MWH-CaK5]|uniref:CaiB/BaiF CoA transferase family protein n=1 Tax=Polynucleobacter sp. MWH-CaK5 TaxID=2689107 RepID=UPI001BFED786|nr:CaiB/BaiF CoA-transferase family protein [Polynucleobacter sp. MWH-CaK5]QWD89032.1 CoA transferase [Polynucleobacter sp. MWH-CaK5]